MEHLGVGRPGVRTNNGVLLCPAGAHTSDMNNQMPGTVVQEKGDWEEGDSSDALSMFDCDLQSEFPREPTPLPLH
eukprot:CAMPEP_0194526922 /NCGR_PEP_ID=MMETSP0253-20130528/62865_1 /TAXON_ID=2966 /ORGANISM="Noctiluca scintillans" /LENGTH=74 /DNA_ID=CAMNT_0039371789 /DNA_START=207 /DNA_END=431 /DNA_ORIENTATION=+